MTTYEAIEGSKTLVPTADDLSSKIDDFLNNIISLNIFGRYVGLFKFRIPQNYQLPECKLSPREQLPIRSVSLEKMPLNGFYKLVPMTDSVKTVSKYVKEVNCWPNNRTIDEYESVFWQGIAQPGWVFEYAQELAPKPANSELKPALGALLTFQPMDAASGGMDAPIEGVTSFYIYLRRAGAFFPPHTENAELFSISLLLPKSDCNALTIWYSIPAADFTRFKNLAASVFVQEFNICEKKP